MAVLFYVAKPFGASWTLSDLAKYQASNPDTVFLPFDLRYNGEFKMDRLAQIRPDVLVISTSRAGTLRKEMFKPYGFYNLSFTAWTTEQLADAFDRATRVAAPRVVIISLDYFLFTNDWDRGYSGTRTMIYGQPWTYLRSSVLDFARTAYKNPQPYENYRKAPNHFIGTQTILSHEGFRADGSYIYSSGHIDDAHKRYQNANSLVSSLPGAPEMSERQMAPIARIAELAKQRGIKLIGLQLPFISSGVKFLDEDASYRYYSGVWRDFESDRTRDWLKGLGITFFDLGHSAIGDDSQNFVDAYHTTDLGAAKVMQELLGSPEFRALFPAIDPVDIKQQIDRLAATPAG